MLFLHLILKYWNCQCLLWTCSNNIQQGSSHLAMFKLFSVLSSCLISSQIVQRKLWVFFNPSLSKFICQHYCCMVSTDWLSVFIYDFSHCLKKTWSLIKAYAKALTGLGETETSWLDKMETSIINNMISQHSRIQTK